MADDALPVLTIRSTDGLGNNTIVLLDGMQIYPVSIDLHADAESYITAKVLLECAVDVEISVKPDALDIGTADTSD